MLLDDVAGSSRISCPRRGVTLDPCTNCVKSFANWTWLFRSLKSVPPADSVVPHSATSSSSVPVAIRSWITFLLVPSSPTTRSVGVSLSCPISCHVAIDINNNRRTTLLLPIAFTPPPSSHPFPPILLRTVYRKWRWNPISMSSPELIWVAKAPTSAKWCYCK